jgi:hypothetical protein
MWTTLKILIALVFLGISGVAQDADRLDPQQVLQQVIAAKGGDRLKAVSRIKFMYGKNWTAYEFPGRLHIYTDERPHPLGKAEQVYDRATGKCEITQGDPPKTFTSDPKNGEVHLATNLLWLLIGGREFDLRPKEAALVTVSGKQYIRLTLEAGGRGYTFLLEPKSKLPVWLLDGPLCRPGDIDCAYYIKFADYHSYGGVMLPSKVDYIDSGWIHMDYNVEFSTSSGDQ